MLQKLKRRYLAKASALLFGLMALLLSGCVYVQSNVAIYGEEAWRGVQAIQLSAEFAEMMAQGNTSTTETTEDGATLTTETTVETEGLDEWLENAQNVANREDLEVAFEEVAGEDGSQSYVLTANGRRFEVMNEVFFDGEADISIDVVDGQRQITIRHDVSDSTEEADGDQELSPEEVEMQMQMMQAMGLGVIFRISGGEIISSNATRVEGNTAIWENPSTIEVTLTEAAEFSPDDISLVAPPAGAGFSMDAFESMLESVEEDFDLSTEEMIEESSDAATQPVMEEAPSTETPLEETTEETTTAPAVEVPAEEIEADSPETLAAAPEAEEETLPESGAVLPQHLSATPFVLAGFVLLALLGAGIATSLRTTRE
jgi:hypothetical protein